MSEIAEQESRFDDSEIAPDAFHTVELRTKRGGDINHLLRLMRPVGSRLKGYFTASQLRALGVDAWDTAPDKTSAMFVLENGQDVTGSKFHQYLGMTTVPDSRGTVGRMKDNGRGLDPHGDLALGAYEEDQFASHTHTVDYNTTGSNHTYDAESGHEKFNADPFLQHISLGYAGGSETNVKATVQNAFVRIN